MKTTDVCHDHYNCCDCGGAECGCGYCFSCHACDYCKDGEGEHCELISDEDFALENNRLRGFAKGNKS